MLNLLKLVTVAALVAPVQAAKNDVVYTQWQQFKTDFKREYKTMEEEAKRFEIFVQNLARAQVLMEKGNYKAKHGVNEFADLSPEEFEKYYLGYKARTPVEGEKLNFATPDANVKTGSSVDWTGKLTTLVKNQGMCGSCW